MAGEGRRKAPLVFVRPAGRTFLEVKVLYGPDMHAALPNTFFTHLGLASLVGTQQRLQRVR